jgi:hypothetical protein
MKTEEELYGLAERRYRQHGTDSIFFCTDTLQRQELRLWVLHLLNKIL